jgi:periplasmic protein TonB
MMLWQQSKNDRIYSAIAAVIIHIVFGYLVISGLGIDIVRNTASTIKTINIANTPPPPDPPPPPPTVAVVKELKPKGAAAPKNIKSKAAARESPKPKVKIKVEKPVSTAEKAGKGNDATAGNADKVGPGTGAGGQGSGTGAGGSGNGSGGLVVASRAMYKSGRLKNSDYPRAASKANAEGTVIVRFTVFTDGRVGKCKVDKSSGNLDLDNTTCQLIEKRFRYIPARDKEGNAIEDVTGWKQTWWLQNTNKNSDPET